jgi:alginate O-acetyltransferase complex protein AlgJ
LGVAIYIGFGALLQWHLHVNVAIKTLTPSHYTMVYAEPNLIREEDKKIQGVLASQFFTLNQFDFNEIDAGKNLRIFMDDSTTNYFIKNIYVELKAGFFTQEIGAWNGREIEEIVLNKNQIRSSNHESVMVKNDTTSSTLFFNDVITSRVISIVSQNKTVLYWRLFSSLILAVFLTLFVFSKPGESKRNEWVKGEEQVNWLSICFALILFIMCIGSLFSIFPDKEGHENRAMAKWEPLKKDNVFQYPQVLSSYIDDHFAFRNSMFFIHSLLKAKLFHASSLPDKVIFGKQGWLFEADEFAEKDFRKLNRFEEEELKQMVYQLKSRVEWCNAHGIKYYIFIPPNRNRIYSEFFPNRYSIVENYGHDRLDFYKKYVKENANIDLLDPTDSLQKYKLIHDVYYSTDTHWNIFGAWVGYVYLLNYLKQDFPALRPLSYDQLNIVDSFNNRGDLSGMLGLEDVYKRKEFSLHCKDTNLKLNFPPTASILMNYDSNSSPLVTDLKLLMFRDSYSNYLIPFMNLHFKEATYVWSYDFMPSLIEQVKPNVVILEVQQRAMIYGLLNENF